LIWDGYRGLSGLLPSLHDDDDADDDDDDDDEIFLSPEPELS